jgi:hypothetical protein|eukprot:COSAG01_NODE_8833_length_2645_cov_1.747840_4_plen_141_part_00
MGDDVSTTTTSATRRATTTDRRVLTACAVSWSLCGHLTDAEMLAQELFQVKNFFYLGNYQMAINEASQGSFSPGSKTELDCLINRSYLGMGNFQLVVGEISDSDAMDLQAVRLLANYLTPGMREGGQSSLLGSLPARLSV